MGSYTNPDANIPVTEEPSEPSISTRGDNGGSAAKPEERNQLADVDASKGSFSVDISAGLETAKQVRVKAEVDVIPTELFRVVLRGQIGRFGFIERYSMIGKEVE